MTAAFPNEDEWFHQRYGDAQKQISHSLNLVNIQRELVEAEESGMREQQQKRQIKLGDMEQEDRTVTSYCIIYISAKRVGYI